MKKSLVAAAVLTAFAGSALAANVTLYGLVDVGFLYTSVDKDQGGGSVDTFQMKSGLESGPRFGLKGVEKISDELSVGFILESGFDADTGALQHSRLFRRESSVYLTGNSWGKLAFGRIGSINQGVSSWGKAGALSAFGTSWGSAYAVQTGQVIAAGDVMDNTIAYQSPTFAGLTVFAQYSMGTGSNSSVSSYESARENRYGALGATYVNGPLTAYLAVDYRNYASNDGSTRDDIDDGYTVTLGGNYDFGVAKVFFGAQYFDSAKLTSTFISSYSDYVDGFGVLLSASIPLCGGKFMIGAGYVDGEESGSAQASYEDIDFKRYVVSAGYDYSLSKRTDVYGVIGYEKEEIKAGDSAKVKPDGIGVAIGIRHRF